MHHRAFTLVFLLCGVAWADPPEVLHESDYVVKLGATFFVTSEEANKASHDGRYSDAAEQWKQMIEREEPGVPPAMRAVVFKPAREAAAELMLRASHVATPTAANLRALFRDLVRGSDFVEHAELGDPRLPALVDRLLTVDADTGRVLAKPFQVLVGSTDLSDTEQKALMGQLFEAMQKMGLKATPDVPVQVEKRVLLLQVKHGKTTAAPPSKHPMVKVPPGAKSCGVEISGRLTENKATLLEVDFSARGTFGAEDQCRIGPLRLAAEAAPRRLIEAAMPKK